MCSYTLWVRSQHKLCASTRACFKKAQRSLQAFRFKHMKSRSYHPIRSLNPTSNPTCWTKLNDVTSVVSNGSMKPDEQTYMFKSMMQVQKSMAFSVCDATLKVTQAADIIIGWSKQPRRENIMGAIVYISKTPYILDKKASRPATPNAIGFDWWCHFQGPFILATNHKPESERRDFSMLEPKVDQRLWEWQMVGPSESLVGHLPCPSPAAWQCYLKLIYGTFLLVVAHRVS